MSDHAVIVRNQGRVFRGGPRLVRAATGEEIDAESLGGADVHCRRSGVTDYYAENDTHALAFARRAVARLRPAAMRSGISAVMGAGSVRGASAASAGETQYHPPQLSGILPPSSRQPFHVLGLLPRPVHPSS